jgi:hypothetical protein
MKNFHLPLPERTWGELRAEAERTQLPATALAREAIDWWLREQAEAPINGTSQARKARRDRIAAWAAEMAGTHFDLDPDLELAGIEQLVHAGNTRK